MKVDTILVFDFGAQYCHLIARRIREQGVYSDVVPNDITLAEIEDLQKKFNVKGIILSGGPRSVYEKDSPKLSIDLIGLELPILGLCYGHQLLAYMLGGKVKSGGKKEYGITYVKIDKAVGMLDGLEKEEKVWMSHGDSVCEIPKDFEIIAHSENSPIAAFKHTSKPIYGLQWHPEVVHTERGDKMLANFIFKVCKCEANWKMEDFIDTAAKEIKNKISDKRAIIGLSGGVDSSTATIIASKAIGKNLTAVFVDHGLIREGEAEEVKNAFEKFDLNFVFIDAKKRFVEKLRGVKDPEQKRKIVGEEFIRVFEEIAEKVRADFLIQGTIYPDRIESGFRKHSDTIKTHHNVGGLPSKIKFKEIIEPLRDLYKDEVRKVAKKLGLPDSIIWRQPFPGPGLAVRIIGEVTPEKIEIIRKADKIVTDEIEKNGLKPWQYFAVLTDSKSTGVKGDARAYGYTIAVRAVDSKEAMTASFSKIPYEILEKISTRITNELPQVNRVVYDITHKPPATIEWE
jgi:GMP synthase (glutamine-hydrolysing)